MGMQSKKDTVSREPLKVFGDRLTKPGKAQYPLNFLLPPEVMPFPGWRRVGSRENCTSKLRSLFSESSWNSIPLGDCSRDSAVRAGTVTLCLMVKSLRWRRPWASSYTGSRRSSGISSIKMGWSQDVGRWMDNENGGHLHKGYAKQWKTIQKY